MEKILAVLRECSIRLSSQDYIDVANELGYGGYLSMIYPEGNPNGEMQISDMNQLQALAFAAALVAYAEVKE